MKTLQYNKLFSAKIHYILIFEELILFKIIINNFKYNEKTFINIINKINIMMDINKKINNIIYTEDMISIINRIYYII